MITMAGKAIFRISKLKSFVAIAGAERHNRRTRTTLNADPDRRQDNFTFMGEADRPSVELARERIGDQKIRKNALLAIEVFISASPEYFRPGQPERAGYWEKAKFEAWLAANAVFLEQEFGLQRILRAECHLDESTPHIHAIVVPLTAEGKLSYRQLYGGKRTDLSLLQDRAWLAVADLGIERGQKGSQAQHRTVQAWYAEIQQPLGADLDEETVRVQLLDRARLERENQQLRDQAAALAQTLEKRNQEKQELVQQNQLMQVELRASHEQAIAWQEKYAQLIDPLRSVSLEQVAVELCLESDGKPRPIWRHQDHQIRINGSQFYDWHERQMQGGGGAIDLVMHVLRVDFKSAVAWLANRFGKTAVQIAGRDHAQRALQEAKSPRFVAPDAAPEQWPAVHAYFVSQQLPGALIDQLHEQGLLYADEQGAAIFLQRDLVTRSVTGAYRLSRDGFSGTLLGSDRAKGRFYWLRGGAATDAVQQVVVGQTPIDTLAVGLMEPMPKERTMYLSADGVLPLEYLQGFSPKRVRALMNREQVGQRLAEEVREKLPQVRQVVPEQEDWVESLRVGRARSVRDVVQGRSEPTEQKSSKRIQMER
jgi:Plasmid recombination enzyme